MNSLPSAKKSSRDSTISNDASMLERLLVDEKSVITDLGDLVDKLGSIFLIEKSTGDVIFQCFEQLTDPQRIYSLLIGAYFANKLGILDNKPLAVSEIGSKLGRPSTALSGPLKSLVDKSYVEKLDKKYRINHRYLKVAIKDTFGDLLG